MSRPRNETGNEYISQLPRITLTDKGEISPGTFGTIASSLRSLINRFNGLLTFGNGVDGFWTGNFDGQWRTVAYSGVAGAQFAVEHGLERKPVFFWYFIDRAGDIYADDTDVASWNNTTIYLKTSVTPVRIKLLIV